MPEFLYQLEHPEHADFQNMTRHIHSSITCTFSKSLRSVLNNSICDQFNGNFSVNDIIFVKINSNNSNVEVACTNHLGLNNEQYDCNFFLR